MILYSVFDCEDVFKRITNTPNNGAKRKFKGHIVNIGSLRMVTLKHNPQCVCCGIKANKIVLESSTGERPHFNVYANWSGYDESGRANAILLTKDHIIPKAKGGKDCLDNMQSMCTICNNIKLTYVVDINILRRARMVYNIANKLKKPKPYKIAQAFIQLAL